MEISIKSLKSFRFFQFHLEFQLNSIIFEKSYRISFKIPLKYQYSICFKQKLYIFFHFNMKFQSKSIIYVSFNEFYFKFHWFKIRTIKI